MMNYVEFRQEEMGCGGQDAERVVVSVTRNTLVRAFFSFQQSPYFPPTRAR